jgi:virginiamycin B lyase
MVKTRRLSPSKLLSVLLAGGVSLFSFSATLAQTASPNSSASVVVASTSKKADPLPVTEIELMTNSQPSALALDARDGAIWFAAPPLGALGRIDSETQKITYLYLGKRAKPFGLAFGPDGALYATDKTLNVLHRIDGTTGELTRIAMPSDLPMMDLSGLRADGLGRIWFAGSAGWLGKYDSQSGAVEVSSHDDLQGLGLNAPGEGGAIWFSAWKAGRMIRLDPTRGRFDSTALPESFRGARGLSTGPQGEIWVSSAKSNAIARSTGRGAWRIITLPWPDSQPQALLARSDGTVIVADGGRRMLLRYRPQTNVFEEIAALGEGGLIRAMIETRNGIAYADSGGDDIRFVPDRRPAEN